MKCLTLDVIASTVFSYKTDIFSDHDSMFLKKLNELFDALVFEKIPADKKFIIFHSGMYHHCSNHNPICLKPIGDHGRHFYESAHV